MNYFEQYNKASREYCQTINIINYLVRNYLEDKVGFAKDAGNKENVGKISINGFDWSILDNNTIQIRYIVCKDRWLDYFDEKYAKVKYNELLKYKEND